MVRKDSVEKVLVSWTSRFRERTYTPAQLRLLIDDYHEDLVEEGFTDMQWLRSAKIARRNSEFFPSMKQILAARETVIRQMSREAEEKDRGRLLEEPPADTSYADQHIKAVTDMLADKYTTEEAVELQYKILREKRARRR